jgi:hypothetical protein
MEMPSSIESGPSSKNKGATPAGCENTSTPVANTRIKTIRGYFITSENLLKKIRNKEDCTELL